MGKGRGGEDMSTNKPAGGAQFTPGPYELRGSRLLTDSNGVVLADNIGANWPGTIEGQANLFAAAPAMYEALSELVKYLREQVADEALDTWAPVFKAAMALAQAEGQHHE